MKNSLNIYAEQPSDDIPDLGRDSATTQALLELDDCEPDTFAEDDEPTEWTGPCCEKCDTPMKAGMVTICSQCGWYASLGMFVEVDPKWEAEDRPRKPEAPAPSPTHLGVWIQMLPKWGWLMVASVLAVVVESVVVRLATPKGSSIRTIWSLAQLTMGSFAFLSCHVINFMGLVFDDTEVGPIDLVMRPVKLWIRGARSLPARLWVANSAACGLMAVAMSLLVIGGLPYERLWDWGFTQPPAQNLMGAVMDRVKEVEDETNKSLEEAVGDFAGNKDVDPHAEEPKPAKPREKVDCVILGYKIDTDGQLSSLILGAAHRGQLTYAGPVTPELSAEETQKLVKSLAAIRVSEPLITIQMGGVIWVKPQYTCRVTLGERQKTGRLTELKWDMMLGMMKTE